MSELCSQQEQSSLVSLPLDKITDSDKDAECNSNQSDKVELLKDKTNSIIKSKGVRQFLFKMFLVFKELVVIMCVAFTYAALVNDTLKLSKSPAAFPFFPLNSVVTDWYHGELSAAIEKARESDIAFVMFYAAWDAESQEMRDEFDLAARYMQKEISFAAVNCWQPGSECRKQYSKAYSWPVLIVYPTHGKGIQYKGPRSAMYMVKFLKSISRPLIRIYGETDVEDLLTRHDAVVVGCVNIMPGSYDYAVFYNAALRFLEKDPMQETVFAVISDSDGEYCEETPSMALHMWNETLLYTNDIWKPNELLMWILNNLHQVSVWLTPMGTKSLALSSFLNPGPALILFTPRNPLDSFVDYYDLLHEVGLEYYNCGNVLLTSERLKAKRKENRQQYSELMKSCSSKTALKDFKNYPSIITYTLPQKWANNSCCLKNSKVSAEKCFECDPTDILTERIQSECHHFQTNNCEEFLRTNLKEKHNHCYKEDKRSSSNLIRSWKNEKCRIAMLAREFHPILFSKSVTQMDKSTTNVIGLACKLNSSLALLTLDSLKYYHFAERLGINLSISRDKTAAVIINQKMEAHHILQDSVNDRTLREFIVNFTNNNLPRALISETTLNSKESYRLLDQRNKSSIRLLELNTKTFFPTVMQDNKAVIVFYYSKQCSFCSGFSYNFLTVAKMFKSINSLQFARLDGDSNILPWAFTMECYPTIILFPIKRCPFSTLFFYGGVMSNLPQKLLNESLMRKSETRVFPRDVSVTIPNLVSFIIVNLNPSLKLHVMWVLCNETKFEDEKRDCITSVRKENLSIISNTLRAWRNADPLTKKKLLYKLQQLRNINMLLAHSTNDAKNIELYLNRLHFAPTYDVQNNKLEKKKFIQDEL